MAPPRVRAPEARAPLYNFAAPLSRKWNDCDMADLKMIVSQGNYLPEVNDMNFKEFMTFFDGPDLSLAEYDPIAARDVKSIMERRIYGMADLYGRYVEFSGKE